MPNTKTIATQEELLAALQACITTGHADCMNEVNNPAEAMRQRLYEINEIARAAIAQALGTDGG